MDASLLSPDSERLGPSAPIASSVPLGTLRDWEQGAKQPDQAARAYLRAIAGDPAGVQRALTAFARQPG